MERGDSGTVGRGRSGPDNGIINCLTQLRLVGHFYKICIMMRGSMNVTLTLRVLMSYIYGAPILDVSRSHTMTQHSR